MADSLAALIYGIKTILLGGVEQPLRSRLAFDQATFAVTDDGNELVVSALVPSYPVHQTRAVKVTGTSYTVNGTTDYHISAQGSGITITLPLTPSQGDEYRVKSMVGDITVAGNGKNIDGASTFAMQLRQANVFLYNGTAWEVC